MMMQAMQCIYVASVGLCFWLLFQNTKKKENCTLLDLSVILFFSFIPALNTLIVFGISTYKFIEWAKYVTVFVWKDDK